MSKRRDDKGHILRSGEIQRSNGRYVYQYTDFTGRRRNVYSSRLEKTDSYPEGSMKREPSLHEKEKAIKDKLESGICDFDTNITVLELAERHISTKTGVKESTKVGYRTTLNIIRNAISIGGDSDTIAAITGSIAEAYYGIPANIRDHALTHLDQYRILKASA